MNSLTTPKPNLPKTPTIARSLVTLLLVSAPNLADAKSWTEARIIAWAKTESPQARVRSRMRRLADDGAEATGQYMNPTVGWQREALFDTPSGAQDIFQLSVPIQIARPLTQRSIAKTNAAWTKTNTESKQNAAVRAVVLLYVDLIAAEQRNRLLQQSLRSLEEASRVLGHREAAGTASGYESSRLAVAKQLVESQVAESLGHTRALRHQLAALLDEDPDAFEVQPTLDLQSLPEADSLAQSMLTERLDLSESRSAVALAEDAADLADWVWIPSLNLSGGFQQQQQNDPDRRFGYVVGLSLGLPLFNRGQALQAQAVAGRQLSLARDDRNRRAAVAQLRRYVALHAAHRAELERFEAATVEPMRVLLTAATAGYREGERNLVELLDAQRSQFDVAERQLKLRKETKHAEVWVRSLGGLL